MTTKKSAETELANQRIEYARLWCKQNGQTDTRLEAMAKTIAEATGLAPGYVHLILRNAGGKNNMTRDGVEKLKKKEGKGARFWGVKAEVLMKPSVLAAEGGEGNPGASPAKKSRPKKKKRKPAAKAASSAASPAPVPAAAPAAPRTARAPAPQVAAFGLPNGITIGEAHIGNRKVTGVFFSNDVVPAEVSLVPQSREIRIRY